MQNAADIATNLVAALLGFVLAQVGRATWSKIKFREERAFWKPVIHKPARIIVSELQSDEAKLHEPAGLTGMGEFRALSALLAEFSNLRLRPNLPVTTYSAIGESDLRDNLVILGGPDVNQATDLMLNYVDYTYAVERSKPDDRNFVRDRVTGICHFPSYQTRKRVAAISPTLNVEDFGVIARMPNPLDSSRSILVLLGAYGYGLLAAAQVCTEQAALLETYARKYNGFFECLVGYELHGGPPGVASIMAVRELKMRVRSNNSGAPEGQLQ